jgi:mannose-6-phosphate isomerase class I
MDLRSKQNLAEALLMGNKEVVSAVAGKLLKPKRNNFVERPWGGMSIRSFKGLCPLPDQVAVSGMGLGEAFELSAWDEEGESELHPSLLRFDDGSEVTLPELLRVRAQDFLGEEFIASYGNAFPLLIKTLDIQELLSVQGHPEGNTELYIIISAEPGATLRLGFRENIQLESLQSSLLKGRFLQEALLKKLGPVINQSELQVILQPWISQRKASFSTLIDNLDIRDVESWLSVEEILIELKIFYWQVLDTMNVIPVKPGQVIYNANPQRLLDQTGREATSEVHALGNPENREILALEIRRPGPTFRAWDNVRFPVRDIDISSAFGVLNLQKTKASEFIIEPKKLNNRPGTFCSLDNDIFCVEHLRPNKKTSVSVPEILPHCLFAIRGRARFIDINKSEIGVLEQGESAIVPKGVGSYRVESMETETEIIKVSLPVGA